MKSVYNFSKFLVDFSSAISTRVSRNIEIGSTPISGKPIDKLDESGLNQLKNFIRELKKAECVPGIKGTIGFLDKFILKDQMQSIYEINSSSTNKEALDKIINDIRVELNYKTYSDTINYLKKEIIDNALDYNADITLGMCARIYEKDKQAILSIIAKEKISLNEGMIDKYFAEHYLEIVGVAHTLSGSNLESLPIDLIGEIFSHINYSDINLS